MRVLGYNGALPGYPGRWGAGHDSAAAILVDGELVAACEEERFNREKHTRAFPRSAIAFCLERAGLEGAAGLDLVAYDWSYPLMFRQQMLTANRHALNPLERTGLDAFLRSMRLFNSTTGFVDEKIRRALCHQLGVDIPAAKFACIPHHLCHVASAYYDSSFDDALCLTLDASGECTSSMVASARGTRIDVLDEVFVPNGLGYLYMFVTDFLGFQSMSDEYKVMGLAPYGDRARYRAFFRSLVRLHDDGRYQVDPALIMHLLIGLHTPGYPRHPRRMREALGSPRRAGDGLEQRHMDIAAGVQEILEETVMHTLRGWQRRTGHKHLCLAGGVALNSTMNGVIARSGIFDGVYIHPAAHDAGTSVGAALYGHHNILRRPRHRQRAHHRYLGPAFPISDVTRAIAAAGDAVTHRRADDIAGEVAAAIADGKVVGFYQGAMEWGPRALGNRSILADPRRADMKDRVNQAVKLREGFRPFAPACLLEKAPEWFDLRGIGESPFMTFVVDVHPPKRALIPAVTHVDGSARVQTVAHGDNPRFHAVIAAFERLTGVPLVLNTSFNVRGEPIVNTPADALRCFLGTGIDLLVLEDVLVEKRPAG